MKSWTSTSDASASNLGPPKSCVNTSRILVVEDSDDLRRFYCSVLELAGYEVLGMATGEDCLSIVKSFHPHLVLLDVILPDMSGIEVCRQIKSTEETAGTLVIHISGRRTSAGDQVEGLNEGADGYLTKPLEGSVLLAHVRALLRTHHTEEALRRVSGEFKAAFENTFDGMFIVDDDSVCVNVNPAGCTLLGLGREQIIDNRFLDLINGGPYWGESGLYWEDLEIGWREFLEQGHKKGEFSLIRPDGIQVHIEYDAKGQFLPHRHLWVLRDVGLHKKSEQAIQTAHDHMEEQVVQRTAELMAANAFLKREVGVRQKAEEDLLAVTVEWEQIFNAIPDQLCIMDSQGVILRANKAMRDRFESTHGDLVGLDHRSCYLGTENTDDESPFARVLSEVLGGGPPVVIETTFPELEGDYLVAAYPLFDNRGAQWGAVSAVRDVTERKRARQALREIEERFQLLIEGIPDYAIFMLDRDGIIVSWNEGARRIHGYESHEIIGKHFSQLYLEEERNAGKPERALQAAIFNERDEQEGWRIAKNGTKFWANMILTTLRDDDGNLRGFSKVTRNITAQKVTQAALKEAEEKYRSIFENAIEGIFQSTPDGKFISANPAMARIFGYASPEEFINDRQDIEREHYVDPKRRTLFKRLIEEKGIVYAFELEAYRKDGTRIWTAENVRAVRDAAGALLYYEGIIEDVTKRKQVEAEQVELLRRLVTAQEDEQRRISRELHDQLGQSLAAVLLGLRSLQHTAQSEATISAIQHLQDVTNQIAYDMHSLVRELRPPALDDLGLHTALSNYLDEWSERTGIGIDFHANGLLNSRLRSQLESTLYRIVQEALNNIVKHAQAKNVSVILEKREDKVMLIIEDDGVGFDTDRLLKTPARERGFGLLGMQERITLAGGFLNIESTLSAGTTLLVHIPTSTDVLEADLNG
jgi:PAS domain S-box-containing protein